MPKATGKPAPDADGPKAAVVAIAPPRITTALFYIEGTAPYMQARFSAKAMQAMRAKMAMGSQGDKTKKPREARDFDDDFKQAQHISKEGWVGIPAASLRNACIDACRMVGYKMTFAKMSIFIEGDGLDAVDNVPLIKLIADPPERSELAVRNQTGVADIRVRPIWATWAANVRVRFDRDQFSISDVTNLLSRAGLQVGIGEGRPFSKESNGMGFGLFSVRTAPAEVKKAA